MTAQRIEAAKPTKPKGSAEGESLVRQDAPKPLAQKDISMTNTTEQQAVTVAQEDALVRLSGDDNDFLSFSGDDDGTGAVMTQHRYYRWGDDCVVAIGEMNHRNTWDDAAFDGKCATLEDRLASVSSASAEGPVDADEFETVEAWEHGDQRELSLLYNHGAHDRPQFNRIQMRQAIRHGKSLVASPKPVPATNQAGDVERRVKDLLRGPDGEEYTDSGMEDAFFRWPVVSRAILAALATQPATSQEGRGCEKCQWSGLERFVGYGNSEETLPCSFCSPATTPTLPTATSQEAEADRLREALEEIDRINGGADWNGTRTIARAALARAQVKAS